MKRMIAGLASAMLANAAWAAPPTETKTTDKTTTEAKSPKTTPYEHEGLTKADKSDEAAIKDVSHQLGKAFDSGDAKTAASYFAEDATLINPSGKLAKGRAEIEKVIATDMQGFLKGSKSKFEKLEVRMVKPDVAYVDMDHVVTGAKGPDGKVATDQPKIHVSGLMVKQGGKWLFLEARPATYLKTPATTPAS